MIRERKSTHELVMPLHVFKRFAFDKACRMAGVHRPPRKPKAPR